jgi:hypothetical protein
MSAWGSATAACLLAPALVCGHDASMSDEVVPVERKPGWYDDGTGTTRWWSGKDWTEHTTEQKANKPVAAAEPRQPARHPLADDPETLWSAIGKPLTGIGAGKYRLTAELLYFETGTISTRAQQISTWQIHDVDASQSMTQRARGVGTITLHARRTSGDEVVSLVDVPDFRDGVRLINDAAYAAGHRKRELEHTQHVNYTGSPAPQFAPPTAPAAPPAPAASGSSDLMAELAKLAEFKQQGLLDDEEFAAAKRKLLGL